MIIKHRSETGYGKDDGLLDRLKSGGDWSLEKTPVINEALGAQRLAKCGLRLMGRTRCTRVVSFRHVFG